VHLALLAAVTAALIQILNLLYLVSALNCTLLLTSCGKQPYAFLSADSPSYVEVALQLREKGVLGASYLWRPPGYPMLIALFESLTGSVVSVLWTAPLAVAGGAAAVTWLGFALGGNVLTAAIAAVLFCIWPGSCQFQTQVLSDGTHGVAVGVAVAMTVTWIRRPTVAWMLATALAWAWVQSLRPVFFVVPLLCPLMLVGKGVARPWHQVAALSGLLCAVPLLVVASNAIHHGIATPSAVGPRTISLYAAPRLKAELGQGEFTQLRAEARARYRRLPIPERIAAQNRDAWAVISSTPSRAALSFANEIRRQLLVPARPIVKGELDTLYPAWLFVPRWLMATFWLLALVGLLVSARDQPGLVLFLGALVTWVLVTSATSHLVAGRLRYPVDVLSFALVAVAVSRSMSTGRRCLRSAWRAGIRESPVR